MILPTKGIEADRALLSVGAEILRRLDETKTVSRLWEEFREERRECSRVTFEWFVLSMDLLFLLGLVELDHGRIGRTRPDVP